MAFDNLALIFFHLFLHYAHNFLFFEKQNKTKHNPSHGKIHVPSVGDTCYLKTDKCVCVCVSTQLYWTLHDPMDLFELTGLLCPWDFPGKSTGVGCHSFSRGSSPTWDQTHISCISRWILYPEPPGKTFTPLLFCKFLDCWKFDHICLPLYPGGEVLSLAQGKHSKDIYERLDICHYYTNFTDKYWDSGKQMSL